MAYLIKILALIRIFFSKSSDLKLFIKEYKLENLNGNKYMIFEIVKSVINAELY